MPATVLTYNVGLEVRNSAWLFWTQTKVRAFSEREARERAIKWAGAQTPRWTAEHDDYCPQDWQFRVIGVTAA